MFIKIFSCLLFVSLLICNVSCKRQEQIVRIIYKHSDGPTIEESEITSYRKDSSIIVQLTTNGKVVKETILKEGYSPIIPLFVKELDTITKEKKCSVIDSYLVYIDNRIITRVDRTCKWNGFSRLRYALFEDN